MAKKRKKGPAKSPPQRDPLLDQVDSFLEGGTEALSPGVRRQLEEETESSPEAPLPETERAATDSGPPEKPTAATAVEHPDLELVLEEGGLRALIRAVHPQSTTAEIRELLERNKISVGLAEKIIDQAVDLARETGQPVRDVVVAQGRAPKPPLPPRIEYCPPEGLDALPALEPIGKLMELEDRDELCQAATSLPAWAVKPKDRLAFRKISEGKAGLSVQGQPLLPADLGVEGNIDPRLQPGPGVELAPDGKDYLAVVCGYAGLDNQQVAVMSPVWVAPDNMEACFLNLPLVPGSNPPAIADLRATLAAAQVSSGIDETALGDLCQQLERGPLEEVLILLARGRPPTPPQDAIPRFFFQYEFQVGAVRADGSIDFKERNLFPSVRQDALLVECDAPRPGAPGQTVRGEELPCAEPISAELVPGENVRLEEQEGVQRLFSRIDGGASVQTQELRGPDNTLKSRQYTIAVQPVAQISEDVGYRTGNIDFQGHVLISGSIASGFRVKATGDIAVTGSIEPGAEVEAGGNIAVQQGILGQETRVRAGGTVSAKFVHDARIQAGADLVVGSYIHGGLVQAAGRVQVEGLGGSGTSGGIVGGRVWAVKGITARNIGSDRSTSTHLVVGIAPDRFARLEKLRQTVRQADIMIDRLLKAVDLPVLQAEEIRRLVARHPSRKNTILHYVKKANQLAQVRDQHLQEQETLSAEIAQSAGGGFVDVPEVAHTRVLVQIGQTQLVVPQDMKGVRFYLESESDSPTVCWEALAEA